MNDTSSNIHDETVSQSSPLHHATLRSSASRLDAAERCLYRKQLRHWKMGAILLPLFVIFITVVILSKHISIGNTSSGAYIARIKADGMIVASEERNKRLKQIAEDTQIKAVILHINSPGGTLAGGEDWYRELRSIAKKKPVIAVVDSMAASGGYMAALGADRIIVREGSIIGSVGVIYQSANIQGLAEKIGIKVLNYASGELKAQPSTFADIAPGSEAMIMRMITDIQQMFLRMVKERRNISDDIAALISDGRIVSGRRSVDMKLADEIGSEEHALAWLQKTAELDENINIKDRELIQERSLFERKLGALMPGWLSGAAERVNLPAGILALHPF